VPQRREVLSLDPREGVHEILPEPVPVDLRKNVLALTADLEAEISRLREKLAANEKKISADDLDKLRDIREELASVVSG